MITTQTPVPTPTKGQRESKLLAELEQRLEAIWRLEIYETYADVAHEVMDRVHQWGHRHEDELTRQTGAQFVECEYRVS